MDIPYIDDSCASDASPQRTLSPLPDCAAPLRLSRYSESSDEPLPTTHLYCGGGGCSGGDELSVNNLLDELSGDEAHSLGSSPPGSRGCVPSPHGLTSPTGTDCQATESGFSDLSSVRTGDATSSTSGGGSVRGPHTAGQAQNAAHGSAPLSDAESGVYVGDVESLVIAVPTVNCADSAVHSLSHGVDSLRRGQATDVLSDGRGARDMVSRPSGRPLSAHIPSSGIACADATPVSPRASTSPVRGMGLLYQNGSVSHLHDNTELGALRRPVSLPYPDVLATVKEHPETATQNEIRDTHRKRDASERREYLDGKRNISNSAQTYPSGNDYPYPLSDPSMDTDKSPSSAAEGYRGIGTSATSAAAGGLLQDVLQALGQPRFEGGVRVDSSSNVTLGPVININTVQPATETPQSTAERKERASKRSSPFSSISKASLTSSACSGLDRAPPSRQGTLRGTNSPLMGRIVSYLRTRCLDTLTRQQPIPWCPEFRLPLQRYYIALGLLPVTARGEQAHQHVPLEEILTPLTIHESPLATCPRRILVEGEPGFGKSTLTLKLLHDWASDEAPAYLAGFQFAFLIPLWEFSGSLFNFTHRELLPRHIVGRDLMVKLWQYLAENEDKVLFLLDGLDELREEHRGEVMDLLSGKLFLNSTVLVTSRPSHAADALPWVQRRLVIQGFAQPSVMCYVEQYFSCVARPEGVGRLEAELETRPPLRELARCPLLCLLICVVFEDCGGQLAESEATLYRSLFECLVRRSLLRRGERLQPGQALPDRCGRMFRQFGKIALQVCLEGRVHYTEQEIVNHVDRELLEWGFLTKVVSVSKVQKKELYQPLHRTFTDFLAAQYLASLPDQTALRQQMTPVLAHIEKLDGQPKSSHSVMVMLRYLVALLNDGQRRAYQALELLGPLGLPPRMLFSLQRAAGSEKLAMQAVATCLASQGHVLVLTDQTDELRGWTDVMSVSGHHESLEVVYRPAATSDALAPLLQVASRRVRSIKLATLLGTDMSGDELRRLGADVAMLLKPASVCRYRLQHLEILLQNLDDNDFGRFQPVVDGLCSALPRVPQSARLKLDLDMDMSAAQMTQLCECLQQSRGVAVLTINHLVSFQGSMLALAELLRRLPLSGLVLRSVWNPEAQTSSAVDFFRSEHLQRSLGGGAPQRGPRGASLTRNYSLGRGAGPVGELDIAYRLRLGREPICDPATHTGGFHHLFSALRTPGSFLASLNLTRCRLTASDLACLGESLRVTSHLTNLTVHNISSAHDLVPVLFALQDNTKLQLLDLTSTLTIEDAEFILLCHSLAYCQELLLLELSDWTFKLEWEHSRRTAIEFLQKTGVHELLLEGCTFSLTVSNWARREDAASHLVRHLPAVKSRIDAVCAEGCHVCVNDSTLLCGPDLMPIVQRVCPRLGAVSLGMRSASATVKKGKNIDDTALLRFFRLCAESTRLRRIRMDNWHVQLTQRSTVEKKLKKLLLKLRVSQVYMPGLTAHLDGVSCVDTFTVTIIAHLKPLQLLSLPNKVYTLPSQAAAIGRGIRDRFPGDKLLLYTRGLPYASLRALRSVIEESDKFIASFTGGELGVYSISRVARQAKA